MLQPPILTQYAAASAKPSQQEAPYYPRFPDVPAKVAESGELVPKELFLKHFEEIAQVYARISTLGEDKTRLFELLQELQAIDKRFTRYTVMAIYGAFALYNHPAKADEVHHTESTLTQALNNQHRNHAKLREWIWGLHWSLLHTLGGKDPVYNLERFTKVLYGHLFTALNQKDVVLTAKVTEEGKEPRDATRMEQREGLDPSLKLLFDKVVPIGEAIAQETYGVVSRVYPDRDKYIIQSRPSMSF
jgi:hypothetical protein